MSKKKQKPTFAIKFMIFAIFSLGIIILARGILLNTDFANETKKDSIELEYNDPIKLLNIPNNVVSYTSIVFPDSDSEANLMESTWLSYQKTDATSVGILEDDVYAEIYVLPANSSVFRVYKNKELLFENNNNLYFLSSNSKVYEIYSSEYSIQDALYISKTKSFFVLEERSGKYNLLEISIKGESIANFQTQISTNLSSKILKYAAEKIYLVYIDDAFECIEFNIVSGSASSIDCKNIPESIFKFTPNFPSYILNSVYFFENRWYINTSQSLIYNDTSQIIANYTKAESFFGYNEDRVYFVEEGSLKMLSLESFPTSYAKDESKVVLDGVTELRPLSGVYLL